LANKHSDTTLTRHVKDWTVTLARAVKSVFQRGNGQPLLVRVGVPVEDLDPYLWLNGRAYEDRIVWQARHHNKVRAMCGTAAEVRGAGRPDPGALAAAIEEVLSRPGDDMRFFGGMRFDPSGRPDEIWQGFPGYRFVLPRFELHTRGRHAQIYCNLIFPEDADRLNTLLEEIAELHPANVEAPTGLLPVPVARKDHPVQEVWAERVRSALELFAGGVLEKVVLARRADFSFADPVNSLLLVRRLAQATPNCFHFHFEAPGGRSFVGATPERLFYRNGLQVDSEAVAGTRPRGATKDDDEAFRDSLLASEKDRREHAYVRDTIESKLVECCDSVTVDHEASEMRLAAGRHLVSRISGVLSIPASDFDLLQRLHPTPAVGGHPTATAVDVIRGLERFDRGWYAGPVGWVGRDAAEFAVALRCGVTSGRRLSLFSGAGIVQGSVPHLEWQEIEQKIVDFVNVIGLDVNGSK
jgi:menaquinone-specific isochorismate synthase